MLVLLTVPCRSVLQKYSRGASERLYDVLNKKHFTEGAVLNDITVLLDAAAEVGVGIDRAECERFLRGHDGEREVLDTVSRVHALGIDSIPCLVIDGGKQVLQGAAHSSTVLDALQRIVKQKNSQQNTTEVANCDAPTVFQEHLLFKSLQ